MDTSIVMKLEWNDINLKWDRDKYPVNTIRTGKKNVWVPNVEVLNRVSDFSQRDEVERLVSIEHTGQVQYTRAFRMRSMLDTFLTQYPFDVQELYCALSFKFSFFLLKT